MSLLYSLEGKWGRRLLHGWKGVSDILVRHSLLNEVSAGEGVEACAQLSNLFISYASSYIPTMCAM